ncbi:MAG: arsenic transporter [Oscillospiraceae bacterium]|nr:arsenic transporter [Oscillospiraceae bacterium]
MWIALGIFVLTYVLLLSLPNYRSYVALASAAVFVIIGIMPVNLVFSSIDWNVLMMIAGTMGIVALFIESKMPNLLADLLMGVVPNVKWAVIALSLFSGIVSAFVDNVATVLMVAPVALAIAQKMKISPIPVVIAIAVSSNLQGAATLVGDTTSILLGGYAGMNFMDFFFFHGKMGMFWVVQFGALAATVVLYFMLYKLNQPVESMGRTKVEDYFPTVLMVGTVVLLILASFLPTKPDITNGLICVALFLIGLVRRLIKEGNAAPLSRYMKEIDWQTLMLLAGLFVVVASIREAGVIDAIAQVFVKIGSGNVFLIYTLIVWVSVLLSAFIDNIPYVATMLPVVSSISLLMGVEPYLLYFGLLCGATLGGNLTPIGASANITGIGILRKAGYDVKSSDFLKIGIPFTLAAVITGYLIIWFLWA